MLRSEYEPFLTHRLKSIAREMVVSCNEAGEPVGSAMSLTGDASGLEPVRSLLQALKIADTARYEGNNPARIINLIVNAPTPSGWSELEKMRRQLQRQLGVEAEQALVRPRS